jgi:gluconolactonase
MKDSMETKHYKDTGSIEIMDTSLLYIKICAVIEIIAEGFEWSEGPLWIADSGYLLFSDIPQIKSCAGVEKRGLTPYLFPSGYTGAIPVEGNLVPMGLFSMHRDDWSFASMATERMARMDAPLNLPSPNS